MSRRFFDAPPAQRCVAIITLRDGSLADCGRRRVVGRLCRQHDKLLMKASTELAPVLFPESAVQEGGTNGE